MRLWLGIWVVLGVLANQWAAAAYVCPSDQARAPCHQHVDKHQPGLCRQHCNPVPWSDVDGKAPGVPPALIPPLPPSDVVRSLVVTNFSSGFRACEVLDAWPPPTVRYCRYLI